MADLLDEFADKGMFAKILYRANPEIAKSIRDYARDNGLNVSEKIAENMSIPADGVLPVVRTVAWALPYASQAEWESDRSRIRVSLRIACADAGMYERNPTEVEVEHLVDEFLRRWFLKEKKARTASLGTGDPNDKPKDKLKAINSLLFTATPEGARSMKDYNSDYSDRIASKIAVELDLVAEEVGFTLRAGLMGVAYHNEKDWAISRRVFRDELERSCTEAGLHERVVTVDDVDKVFAMFIKSWYVFEKRWSDFRLVFEREDSEKEKKIEARLGWFVEFKARGLKHYPPPWLLRDDRRWKELIADRYKQWKERSADEGMYIVYHLFEASPEGVRHNYYSSGLSPQITQHYKGPNGKIGHAEYQGRRAGVKPGLTEKSIEEEIVIVIKSRLPDALTDTQVQHGEYHVRVLVPESMGEDATTLKKIENEIEQRFRQKYSEDIFNFVWGLYEQEGGGDDDDYRD